MKKDYVTPIVAAIIAGGGAFGVGEYRRDPQTVTVLGEKVHKLDITLTEIKATLANLAADDHWNLEQDEELAEFKVFMSKCWKIFNWAKQEINTLRVKHELELEDWDLGD